MEPLIRITGKDLEAQLGEFISTGFQQIKWDIDGVVVTGTPSKKAKILVRMDFGVELIYAEKCAEHFNGLGQEIIDELYRYSLKYCLSYCEYYGEEPPELKDDRDLLYYIEPFCMYIENPESEDIAYVIELHCDWESEHGMSWIIRNDKVLYVGEGMVKYHLGAWEDLDAYKNDAGNFVFGAPDRI